jgi:hypothetical protein
MVTAHTYADLYGSDLDKPGPGKSHGAFEQSESQLPAGSHGGQGRDRTADLPLFRRTLVPTELPGRRAANASPRLATLTGLEPATSAVTGRRANQLRHRALLLLRVTASRTPNGIRTRATAVKGRRPRPLDDGGQNRITPGYSQRGFVGSHVSLGHGVPNPQTSLVFGPSILNLRGPYSSVGRATDF